MKLTYFVSLLLFTNVCQSAPLPGSYQTNICIRNTTVAQHQINAANIDNYDWDGVSRPDKNFNNITILPGETICRREETNKMSKPRFTFVIDGAPSDMVFSFSKLRRRADGDDYVNEQWFTKENTNNPLRLHGETTIWFQPNDWKLGYSCTSGEKCRLFEIR